MTDKLVVIINSLKVPKIKKILLYEMKFLVRNYSCLQKPWLGVYRPLIPVLFFLCPQLNLLNHPSKNKIPGYATAFQMVNFKLQLKCICPNKVTDRNSVNTYNSEKYFQQNLYREIKLFGIPDIQCAL